MPSEIGTKMYATQQEAIDAAMKDAEEQGYVDFDGQNCADAWDEGENCAGWDGVDRRCDCGNRRVYWETSKQHDGTWVAWAVAD